MVRGAGALQCGVGKWSKVKFGPLGDGGCEELGCVLVGVLTEALAQRSC